MRSQSRRHLGLQSSDGLTWAEESASKFTCVVLSGGLNVLPCGSLLSETWQLAFPMSMWSERKANLDAVESFVTLSWKLHVITSAIFYWSHRSIIWYRRGLHQGMEIRRWGLGHHRSSMTCVNWCFDNRTFMLLSIYGSSYFIIPCDGWVALWLTRCINIIKLTY